MRRALAFFLGYGLLPLWASFLFLAAGGLGAGGDYWAVAPWSLVVGVYLCGATLVIAAITVSIHANAMGDGARKDTVAARAFWAMNGVLALAAGVLWLRGENAERGVEAERARAIEFVRNHAAVIEKAGAGVDVRPSMTAGFTDDGRPLGYELMVDTKKPGERYLFAIVRVDRTSGEFRLECLTATSTGRCP